MDNKDYNLISLGPTANADTIDIYRPFLENAINSKDDDLNCNKYLNKNIAISGGYATGKSSIIKTFFNDYKYLSKVRYVTLGNYLNTNKHYFDADDIEISIIQQILYSVNPEKLPTSRIDRIDINYKAKYIQSIICSVVIILLLWLYIIIKNYCILKEVLSFKINAFIFSFIISFSFIIVFNIILFILSNFRVSKISFKSTGIEFFNNDNISSLNKYLDELFNFFLSNPNIDFIVFEDIDRLPNCVEVFSKLKEINTMLNSRISGERTIRFIYLVKDDIFDNAENRSKFFDIIIPIVPYTSFLTIKNHLKRSLDDFNDSLNCIDIISSYIDNIREVYDIVNEYKIYRDTFLSSISSDIGEDYINDSLCKILVLCVYKVMYFKRFNNLINNKGPVAFYFSHEFEQICSKNENYNNIYDIPFNIKKSNLSLKINNSDFEVELDDKEKNRNKDAENFNELNSFEELLIENNLIEPDYSRLIINKSINDLSLHDEELLIKIIRRENISYDYDINEVKKLFDQLSFNYFKFDSICINKLFDYILSLKNYSIKYLDQFYLNINEKKLLFLLQYNNNSVFKVENSFLDNVINKINVLEENSQAKLLCRLIPYYGNNIINNKVAVDIIENNNFIFNYIDDDYEVISECFGDYSFSFKQESINTNCFKMIDYIFDNCFFDDNYKLLKCILKIVDSSFDELKFFDYINFLENESLLKKHLINNLGSYSDFISKSYGQLNDSTDSIKNIVIMSNQIDDTTKIKLLSIEYNKLNDLNGITGDLLRSIYDNNLFVINFSNIIYFNKNLLGYDINKSIKENIDNLLININECDKDDLFIYVVDNNNIELNCYKRYIDAIELSKLDVLPNNISADKLQYYLNKSNIKVSSNQLYELVNKLEETNEKYIFVSKNQESLSDQIINVLSNDCIKYMINNKMLDKAIFVQLLNNCIDRVDLVNVFIDYLCDNVDEYYLEKVIDIIKNSNISIHNKLSLIDKYLNYIKDKLIELSSYLPKEFNDVINQRCRFPLISEDMNYLIEILDNDEIKHFKNKKVLVWKWSLAYNKKSLLKKKDK